VLRFNAKIDTSVVNAINRSTASVPRIDIPPMATGRAAVNKPPNTQTSTTKLSGTAIASINSMSRCAWSVICALTIATPPDRTVTPLRS